MCQKKIYIFLCGLEVLCLMHNFTSASVIDFCMPEYTQEISLNQIKAAYSTFSQDYAAIPELIAIVNESFNELDKELQETQLTGSPLTRIIDRHTMKVCAIWAMASSNLELY